MPSGIFNVARGRINALVQRVLDDDPAPSELLYVVLTSSEADATLKTRRTLAEVLVQAGNVEAANAGYSRLVADQLGLAVNVSDALDRAQVQVSDDWFSGISAGLPWVKLLTCYTPDSAGATDAQIIPMTWHTFLRNPRGKDVGIAFGGSQIPDAPALGFYMASKE